MSRLLHLVCFVPIAAGLVLLSACGKADHGGPTAGATVGVSESFSSGSDTTLGREFSRLRKMSSSRDAKANASAAADSVVDPAFAFTPDGKEVNKLAFGVNGAGQILIKSADDARAISALMADGDPFKAYLLEVAVKTAAQAEPGSPERANALLKEASDVMLARTFYGLVVTGTPYWEVAQWPMPFGMRTNVHDEQARLTYQAYTRAYEIGLCIAAELGGGLAKEMQGAVIPDPRIAREWAKPMSLVALKSSASDVLVACSDKLPLDSKRIWDGTTKDVSWSTIDRDGARWNVTCTAGGCEATKNKVQQFGQNHYAGVAYELQFARSTSSGIDWSNGMKQGESTKQGTASQGKVGIGN
jgi:hypothetical protein